MPIPRTGAPMSSELSILGLYGLFTILTILVQATVAQLQVGLPTLLKPRDDMPRLVGVAGRMERAQLNAIVAMALFAPAVLILAHKGISTPSTLLAAQAFLIARVLYVPLYAFGLPGFRPLVWVIGIFATGWLFIAGF
jgi:uncharacterized MAPEG superfamily protein